MEYHERCFTSYHLILSHAIPHHLVTRHRIISFVTILLPTAIHSHPVDFLLVLFASSHLVGFRCARRGQQLGILVCIFGCLLLFSLPQCLCLPPVWLHPFPSFASSCDPPSPWGFASQAGMKPPEPRTEASLFYCIIPRSSVASGTKTQLRAVRRATELQPAAPHPAPEVP
jgi:hypothetical protein